MGSLYAIPAWKRAAVAGRAGLAMTGKLTKATKTA